FPRMVRTAPGPEPTGTALAAPRESASMATAPVPENRSSTRAPWTSGPRLENRPSRARSVMGRVPGGTGARRVPFDEPATILTEARPVARPSAVEQPLDGLTRDRLPPPAHPLRMPRQVGLFTDHGARPAA